jgi:hypothetical protein
VRQGEEEDEGDAGRERAAPGEPQPDPGHRRSDAELEAEHRRAWHDARRPGGRAAEGEREQDQPARHARRGDLAGREPSGDD